MSSYGSECYTNRELSLLDFEDRVLGQAGQPSIPLLERLKFLSIALHNLDEFYMIRVGSIFVQIRSGYSRQDAAGLTPKRQLAEISDRTARLYKRIYRMYGELVAELAAHGVRIFGRGALTNPDSGLTDEQIDFCSDYFAQNIYPTVTPALTERGHPFPFVPGRCLCMAAAVLSGGKKSLAVIQLPAALGRTVKLPSESGTALMPVEEIVRANIQRLFPRRTVVSSAVFRITRNGDRQAAAEGADDLLEAVKKTLVWRKRGETVRLEIEDGADPFIRSELARRLNAGGNEIFDLPSPIDPSFPGTQIYSDPPRNISELKYPQFTPNIPSALLSGESIFDSLKKRDCLLYHPFDSFEPVVRLLSEAAGDPDVVSVRITLYRLSDHSPIVVALAAAAIAGKQVTVVLEPRARFDEENNIVHGEALEKAGVHVIYGLPDVKVHSKIALVTRREPDGMRTYMQLGTGNYNDVTARQYTDYSLLTAHRGMCADGVEFFRALTGGLEQPEMKYLVMSPFGIRSRICEELKTERAKAACGKPASFSAKMNSLSDKSMIKKLFKASCAGVKIRLHVRGICCLRPGVDGVSENIAVTSTVGRFLEHSRVYCFGEGDDRRVLLSSADLMTRNLDRRVELLFPVLDRELADRIAGQLERYFAGGEGTYTLGADGKYTAGTGESPQTAILGMTADEETDREAEADAETSTDISAEASAETSVGAFTEALE